MVCSLAMLAVVSAAAPRNPSIQEYSKLTEPSPFILKKVELPTATQKPVNTSLSLRGVVKMDDGWWATVVDRKDPTKPITLREGKPAGERGISLSKVMQNVGDYKKTQVVVNMGGRLLTVGYNTAEIKKNLAKGAAASVVRTSQKPSTQTSRTPQASPTTKPSTSSSRRPRVRRSTTTK